MNSVWTTVQDLNVGDSGHGTLNILAGGRVTNASGFVANTAGSTGEVTVDGAQSFWGNSADLYVGTAGNGSLGTFTLIRYLGVLGANDR